MGLLAVKTYDPAAADATKTTAAAAVMAVLDTTNLRNVFTVPANGNVLVRLRGVVHGATTYPQIFLGVLEGSTVRLRMVPLGGLKTTAVSTAQFTQEVLAVVPGMTPGASLTWDAAFGVETGVASTAVKWGGPNNTTTNDAFGAFSFEIYDTPNLLGAILYDPAGAVTKDCTNRLAMTAIDTSNLRITFTVPPSGAVLVRMRTNVSGQSTYPSILLGILEGAAVKCRQSPVGALLGAAAATNRSAQEMSCVVTGLTPGTSLTWDAAYGVEILLATTGIKYGGPNDTTGDNAWGAFGYEIWAL